MNIRSVLISFLVMPCFLPLVGKAGSFTVRSDRPAVITMKGFDGLTEKVLHLGSLMAEGQSVETSYRGLALVGCQGGTEFPVIIGDTPFTIHISDCHQPPKFSGTEENSYFYGRLHGERTEDSRFGFANLMLAAKILLDSAETVNSVSALSEKKKEFCQFVASNYEALARSDLLSRFLAQSLEMHEYVSYHRPGEPPSSIHSRYQEAVLDGVGQWLNTLQPFLPEREVLNTCVALFFRRSMVSIANVMIETFPDAAYCPGEAGDTIHLPDNAGLLALWEPIERNLIDLPGEKLIAFVSTDCPVSMVSSVSRIRALVQKQDTTPFIIAPLEQLSPDHLAMARMVSGGNMMFVKDQSWQRDISEKRIKLPHFRVIGEKKN